MTRYTRSLVHAGDRLRAVQMVHQPVRRCWFAAILLVVLAAASARAGDTVLLDFEDQADLGKWSPVVVSEVSRAKPESTSAPCLPAAGTKADAGPTAASVELSDQNATSGKHALKIIFHGGQWSGVTNASLPVAGNWQQYNSIKLDVTTKQEALMGLRLTQRKGPADPGAVWERTIYLVPGKNEVLLYLKHPEGWGPVDASYGDVASLVIYMYRPADGQTLFVDNVRLSPDKPARGYFRDPQWTPYGWEGHSMSNVLEFARTGKLAEFEVAGTDMTARGCAALAARFRNAWTPPQARTVEQVEADFRTRFAQIRKDKSKAVLAIFREGEKGFDPANPDKEYAGWKDAHIDSHGPDGPLAGREMNSGKNDAIEAFMRHRALLAQADLSAIPKGSKILAAQLVLNRVGDSRDATKMPTMWVAEPCTRDWNEYEVNGYQYANGKLWKAINGCYYGADDPDFRPVFLAYGPGQGPSSAWDFTEAVKYWTGGTHENHGFLFHGDSQDYMLIATRENKQTRLRPAIMVIYEPAVGGVQ